MQRQADEQQGADQLGKKASHTWHPYDWNPKEVE
jgi:hypothetical protein